MSPTATATATAPAAAQAAPSGLLDGLDMRIVESGPATQARRCSTDNGCDTQKTGDC